MAIIDLDNMCKKAKLGTLGTFLNALELAIDGGTAYAGSLPSVSQIGCLNDMCVLSRKSELGTILNNVLTASKNEVAISQITETQVKDLNKMCAYSQKETLGTKISTYISAINLKAAPLFVSSATNINGTIVNVVFDQAIDDVGLVSGDFVVDVDETPVSIASVGLKSGDATTVEITLTAAVNSEDVLALTYTKGTLKGENGTLVKSFNGDVTNNVVAPLFVSAATNVSGEVVSATFDLDLSEVGLVSTDFVVNVDDTPATISTIGLKSEEANIIEITLASAVTSANVLDLSYTKGTLKGANGTLVESFVGDVTNNVPAE